MDCAKATLAAQTNRMVVKIRFIGVNLHAALGASSTDWRVRIRRRPGIRRNRLDRHS